VTGGGEKVNGIIEGCLDLLPVASLLAVLFIISLVCCRLKRFWRMPDVNAMLFIAMVFLLF